VLRLQVLDRASGLMLLNNNQVGVILQANSGLPFNIRSNGELNKDGLNNDRPLFVERNSGRLGKVVYLDLSLLAFIPIAKSSRAELFVEAKNLSIGRTSRASTAW